MTNGHIRESLSFYPSGIEKKLMQEPEEYKALCSEARNVHILYVYMYIYVYLCNQGSISERIT